MALGPLAYVDATMDPHVEEMKGRYFGPRMGFVRDRNDPRKLGRVRVWIPSMFSEQDGDRTWTDWCLPRSPGLNVPPLNANVFVEFEMGIVSHGVYSAGWHDGSGPSDSSVPAAGKGLPDETWLQREFVATAAGGEGPDTVARLPPDSAIATKPVYPFNKVYESESGHILELDDSKDAPRARYYHPKGTTILVDSDGSVQIRSAGAQYFKPEGDFVVALTKGATFKVIYDKGTSFSCGAQGFHVRGQIASILGRNVSPQQGQI